MTAALQALKLGKTSDGKPGPQLPITVMVHTSQPPFDKSASLGGSGGETGGWHVARITDFRMNPKTGKPEVGMDNQWGTNRDALNKKEGGLPYVPVETMFRALSPSAKYVEAEKKREELKRESERKKRTGR
jgi:hypothetical protein